MILYLKKNTYQVFAYLQRPFQWGPSDCSRSWTGKTLCRGGRVGRPPIKWLLWFFSPIRSIVSAIFIRWKMENEKEKVKFRKKIRVWKWNFWWSSLSIQPSKKLTTKKDTAVVYLQIKNECRIREWREDRCNYPTGEVNLEYLFLKLLFKKQFS